MIPAILLQLCRPDRHCALFYSERFMRDRGSFQAHQGDISPNVGGHDGNLPGVRSPAIYDESFSFFVVPSIVPGLIAAFRVVCRRSASAAREKTRDLLSFTRRFSVRSIIEDSWEIAGLFSTYFQERRAAVRAAQLDLPRRGHRRPGCWALHRPRPSPGEKDPQSPYESCPYVDAAASEPAAAAALCRIQHVAAARHRDC